MKSFLFDNEIANKILSILKEQKKTNRYCITRGSNVNLIIKRPTEYLSPQNAYEFLKQLDEAKYTPPIETFESIAYTDITINASSISLGVRCFKYPFFVITNSHIKCSFITASFNPSVTIYTLF